MDSNLTFMVAALNVYVLALAIGSSGRASTKGLAVPAILTAFWFGFSWNGLIGIGAVFLGVFLGVITVKLFKGK